PPRKRGAGRRSWEIPRRAASGAASRKRSSGAARALPSSPSKSAADRRTAVGRAAGFAVLFALPVERVIGGDDGLHERMADDIPFVEEHETNSFDGREQLLRLPQARGLSLWQVDLRDIAGDDRP